MREEIKGRGNPKHKNTKYGGGGRVRVSCLDGVSIDAYLAPGLGLIGTRASIASIKFLTSVDEYTVIRPIPVSH